MENQNYITNECFIINNVIIINFRLESMNNFVIKYEKLLFFYYIGF